MNKIKELMLVIVIIVSGCDQKENDLITMPTNLAVIIQPGTDAPGKVVVTATADNAEYFNIFFGENANETPVESADGKAEYQYAASGTYTIKVQAHVDPSAFISKERNITITIPTPVVVPVEGYTTPETYSDMTLVWQDEFNGALVNETDWTFETGRGSNGWGNNELQYYRKENASVQDGNLIITAKSESFQGADYTSTRMITKDKRVFQYGRIDIRAVLPKGKGVWPALWMLGNNINSVGWPKCGEIDIMEKIGGEGHENKTYGTLHWDNGGYECTCGHPGYSLDAGIFADKFHVFSIVWDESSITWYVDDVEFRKTDIAMGSRSEFHGDFFFIFNVAVGGNWPGSPDGTTIFPQHMIVDYVRIFQKN